MLRLVNRAGRATLVERGENDGIYEFGSFHTIQTVDEPVVRVVYDTDVSSKVQVRATYREAVLP